MDNLKSQNQTKTLKSFFVFILLVEPNLNFKVLL